VRAASGPLFHEIHVKADVAVCEGRDPKGLYAKARRGEIVEFTGVSSPYEPPLAPELEIDTGALSVDEAVAVLRDYCEAFRSGPGDQRVA
jgi:adenylylsulfate kinase-like enzyme